MKYKAKSDTQKQMYSEAQRRIAEGNLTMLDLLFGPNPISDDELKKWNVLNFLDLGILPPSPLSGGDMHAYYAYATLADGRPLIPFNAAGNGGLSDLVMIAMSGPTLHPLGPTIPGQTS
jgi:hypothetical protein